MILYHEVECNYDETRIDEESVTDPSAGTRVIDHTPRRIVRVINEHNVLTESKAINIEWMKKSKSKSQLSLSTLEINVLFLFFCSVVFCLPANLCAFKLVVAQ